MRLFRKKKKKKEEINRLSYANDLVADEVDKTDVLPVVHTRRSLKKKKKARKISIFKSNKVSVEKIGLEDIPCLQWGEEEIHEWCNIIGVNFQEIKQKLEEDYRKLIPPKSNILIQLVKNDGESCMDDNNDDRQEDSEEELIICVRLLLDCAKRESNWFRNQEMNTIFKFHMQYLKIRYEKDEHSTVDLLILEWLTMISRGICIMRNGNIQSNVNDLHMLYKEYYGK